MSVAFNSLTGIAASNASSVTPVQGLPPSTAASVTAIKPSGAIKSVFQPAISLRLPTQLLLLTILGLWVSSSRFNLATNPAGPSASELDATTAMTLLPRFRKALTSLPVGILKLSLEPTLVPLIKTSQRLSQAKVNLAPPKRPPGTTIFCLRKTC